MDEMKEIQLDNNDTGLKVFVNGEPDLSLIPESLMDCFIEAMIEQIAKNSDKNSRGQKANSAYIKMFFIEFSYMLQEYIPCRS